MMRILTTDRLLFPSPLAVFVLASAMAVPAVAQQASPAGDPQNTPSSAVQQPSPSANSANTDKEGFWGHLNPFARKKWVNKRVDPLKDRVSELGEVDAKNARDIQDVDARAQAGIHNAKSAADAANQTATTAGDQARKAGDTAQQANGHVNQLNTTVNGLDQYRSVNQVEVVFHGSQPILSAAARKQLDDLAAGLAGREGYILEIEGHYPVAGPAGIQASSRLNDAVKRYLLLEHQIPVYRMHAVALGNARVATDNESATPVRVRSVDVRLMENSLAAQDAAPPQSTASLKGAERP